MSEGVFLSPRVASTGLTDPTSCKQLAQTTAFGTAGLVISNKPGRLYRLRLLNKSATVYYVQVHNKAFAPVNNDVPVWEFKLPASVDSEQDFGLAGLSCSTGISIALSSTPSLLTLAIAADGVAYGLHQNSVTPPVVTLVTAATGSSAGGTNVTITGSGFGGATGATFGGDAATSFVVASNTSITCTTPAHAAGLVDVIVTCPTSLGGAGKGVGLFTYT